MRTTGPHSCESHNENTLTINVVRHTDIVFYTAIKYVLTKQQLVLARWPYCTQFKSIQYKQCFYVGLFLNAETRSGQIFHHAISFDKSRDIGNLKVKIPQNIDNIPLDMPRGVIQNFNVRLQEYLEREAGIDFILLLLHFVLIKNSYFLKYAFFKNPALLLHLVDRKLTTLQENEEKSKLRPLMNKKSRQTTENKLKIVKKIYSQRPQFGNDIQTTNQQNKQRHKNIGKNGKTSDDVAKIKTIVIINNIHNYSLKCL